MLKSLACLVASVLSAELRGSLDACSEDSAIPWAEVRRRIAEVDPAAPAEDAVALLRSAAFVGGVDLNDCDCWYGWITLRFFVPQVLSSEERLQILEEQLFHTEFLIWLGSPWMEMLDSEWKPLEALAGSAKVVQRARIEDEEGCSPDEYRLLKALPSEVDSKRVLEAPQLAPLSAAVLLALPEDILSLELSDAARPARWDQPCPSFAAAAAAAILGMAPMGFRVTPGYGLRLTQQILKRTANFGLLRLLSSPWQVAQLLPLLAAHLREGRSRASKSEDDLAAEVMESSRQEFPDLHPSFLPPMAFTEKLKLLQGVATAHAALTAAQVPYFAITGTLLGAVRHHSFVPWDGDADFCVDINDEVRLLHLVLLQGDCSAGLAGEGTRTSTSFRLLLRAMTVLAAAGFELWAHAERPLTFKLASRSSPRVPGKMYGYPYMDLWFCHGWAAGDFSLQSATFGVPLSREVVFPRRKLFFAGLALWSFGDPRESILQYYQGSNALEFCVGHDTFHRQERKYSEENELHRFDGNAPCATLADTFAFAGPWQEGPPEGISGDLILAAVHSFLLLQEPRWALDPDPTLAGAYETFRRARAEEMLHVASEGRLRPGQFQSLQTSQLTAPFGEAVHHLLQAALALEPAGSCDLVLRLRPIRQEASSSLGYVASPSAVSMREQILEAGGRLLRFDVPSCVCRMRLGSLGLQWVAEDARS